MESMLKVLFYINIFAILMSCHSCRREKANVGITNVVEEWINKEIKFDNEYVFTRLGKDSVYNSIPTSKYKILVYTDSIGCADERFAIRIFYESHDTFGLLSVFFVGYNYMFPLYCVFVF